ncbi:MAG: 30S ribosomal protein S11 [Deltaproteobacteria bacterium CG11_big_fil_rev_8_21_14_0_20_49_13]|nr:MAG: 30S ribosomal protein S11 [Deltaproteobacteria bacterium CG11_big_fil_rev_8_21_14_0_20_49_13]
MSDEIKEVKETKDAKPKPPKPEKTAAPEGAKPAGAKPEGAVAVAGEAVAVVKKKKNKKNVAVGIVNIQATFNNTIITIADPSGNVLCWATSGGKGFKGSKKGTPFAAQLASETACRKALEFGMKSVTVYVRGPGAGRESAVRAIAHTGLRVSSIRDLTPIPHNGCRPPKRRRI